MFLLQEYCSLMKFLFWYQCSSKSVHFRIKYWLLVIWEWKNLDHKRQFVHSSKLKLKSDLQYLNIKCFIFWLEWTDNQLIDCPKNLFPISKLQNFLISWAKQQMISDVDLDICHKITFWYSQNSSLYFAFLNLRVKSNSIFYSYL